MNRFLHFIIANTLLVSFTFFERNNNSEKKNKTFNGTAAGNNTKTINNFITYAEVDNAADQIASTKQIFSFQESRDLKARLQKQLENNSSSITINWALMRFYASAPNFVGGNTSLALQFAGYIYSLNQYLGCMAFEYVYSKRKDMENAEKWYKHSLNVPLSKDMYWEEIAYHKTPQTSIKVSGNFNNWKTQNMYANAGGTFKRKVMVPKCETCVYKVIVDYKNIATPSRKYLSESVYW